MEYEDYLKRIGEKIMHLRKEKGITQIELAKILGTKHTQIGRLERGEANATIKTLFTIAKELGVSITELMDWKN